MASILGIMSILSIPGWKETWHDIKTRSVTLPNHRNTDSFLDLINPRLLSIEWMFLVITFVMGVSFVSIMRPMPIGWDDLGVYMNWPKIMALNEEVLH